MRQLVISWAVLQTALGMFLVSDPRMERIKNIAPRELSRENDEFDEWRTAPSDKGVNVMARLSFDKAEARFRENERAATQVLKEKVQKRPISFRFSRNKGANAGSNLDEHTDVKGSLEEDMKLDKVPETDIDPHRILGPVKFTRKVPQIEDLAQNENPAPPRELFLMSNYSDKEKQHEQMDRMSVLMRDHVSRAMNKYAFTEHLSHWSKDSIDEIHRFYLQGLREIKDSQDFLVDKMDDIYNNFITPVRWNQ